MTIVALNASCFLARVAPWGLVAALVVALGVASVRPARAGDAPPRRAEHAHTAAVAGTLREAGVRAPLVGVLVTLLKGDADDAEVLAEAWTDADGAFAFEGLAPAARGVLVVDEPGFERLVQPLELAPGASVEVALYVARRAPGDDAAHLYETRARSGGAAPGAVTRALDVEVIEQIAAARNDPLGALQSLPGVARTALGTSHLALRGAPPQDARATLDGVVLPRAFHSGGLRALLPAAALERVALAASNPPLAHGNVLGGLVALETRAPSRELHHGQVALDFIEALALAEGPLTERLQYMVGARRSFLEVFTPLIAEASQVELETSPRYWDYLARLTWQPAPRHELELFAFGAGDTAELTAHDDTGARETLLGQTQMHRVWLRHRYRSARLSHDLVYSVGPNEIEARDDNSSYALSHLEHQLRETLGLRIDPRLTVQLGADATHVDGWLRADAFIRRHPVTLERDARRWALGAFLGAVLEPADGVLVELGGRLDYDRLVEAITGDLRGRLSAGDDRLRVSLALASASQSPHPLDVHLMAEPAVWQRARHAALALAWQLPGYEPLSLEVSGFHISREHLPALTSLLPPWLADLELRQQGEQRSTGLEIVLRHALANRFVGWIAYTLSRTQGRRAPDDEWARAPYDQPHNLQVVGAVLLPDRWRLSARFGVVSGAPYTPDTRELFGTVVGHRFDPPVEVEPFHRLDVRVDKTWLFDLWQLAAWLDVQGVYFHQNVEFAGRTFVGRPYRARGLPILPSLGVSARY